MKTYCSPHAGELGHIAYLARFEYELEHSPEQGPALSLASQMTCYPPRLSQLHIFCSFKWALSTADLQSLGTLSSLKASVARMGATGAVRSTWPQEKSSDPLDIIPDISLQAMDLNGVESELFS